MKTAGIVIDRWKLKRFRKALTDAGYKFTQHSGIAKGTLILKVECEDVAKLQPLVVRTNNACMRSKMN